MGLEKETKMSPALWIPLHNGLDLQLVAKMQLNLTDKHSCLISQGQGIVKKKKMPQTDKHACRALG